MSRIILIEGADTLTVKHVIGELQSKLEKEGKKVISAMFPRAWHGALYSDI